MCPIYVLDFHRRGIVTNMPKWLDKFALNGKLSVYVAILGNLWLRRGAFKWIWFRWGGHGNTQYIRNTYGISRIAAALPIKRNDGGFRWNLISWPVAEILYFWYGRCFSRKKKVLGLSDEIYKKEMKKKMANWLVVKKKTKTQHKYGCGDRRRKFIQMC